MAHIEYRNVNKRFPDGTEALVDLNLEVEDGELMVLVGPSGCGKSTALRLLAGLETPTSGELRIGGTVVNALPPARRNLAMVFQNYALYPHMTVRANLTFPLKMARLPRAEIERRVQRVAGMLDLGALLDRKPAQLSGGQRQRVAMGRALVREPQAFLLDEPLSNLDAKLRTQIRTEIAALQRRLRATVVYVTHDQVEAMTLGRRVAVLNQGRLQQVAPPQTLYDHPANTFVAQFIGSPGMNLFPVTLAQKGAVLTVRADGLEIELPASTAHAAPRLRAVGEPLWAGVRPEALCLTGAGGGQTQARVVAVERLGHEQLVYLETACAPGRNLCARLDAHTPVAIGATVGIQIELAALHLFGPDGRALAAEGRD